MSSSYVFLPQPLHGFAEEAKAYFSQRYGIAPGKFAVETRLRDSIRYGPTLHVTMRDHHILCVEVAPSFYTDSLSNFVLDCQREALPVQLYVAVPPDSTQSRLHDLESAVKNGVGCVQLGKPPTIIHSALSLSLTGVRHPKATDFPRKIREDLHRALDTFLQGNPGKGCQELYDEVEAIIRRVAEVAEKKVAWRRLKQAGKTTPGLDWAKDSWATVMESLYQHLDIVKLGCPQLTPSLLSRVIGLVEHRNDVGHKPRNLDDLIERDTSLRTRFEHACDTLRELCEAVKVLKV